MKKNGKNYKGIKVDEKMDREYEYDLELNIYTHILRRMLIFHPKEKIYGGYITYNNMFMFKMEKIKPIIIDIIRDYKPYYEIHALKYEIMITCRLDLKTV